MSSAEATAGLSSPPDPTQDRPGKPVPQNIADLLAILHVLIGYGLHLAETLEHRAAARGFAVVAQFFGTARVAAIRNRLARGLLRAMALERVLLARAARGRDLVFYKPRKATPRATPPAHLQAAVSAAMPERPQPRPVRRADPDEVPDPARLPTLDQLEADIRRRPVGRALADICSDLGVSPSLCEGRVWLAVSCAIMWYRGNLPRLMKEFRRREVVFCNTEADRNPALGWPERTRDGNRRMLGFFIGETPVMPFPGSSPLPILPPLQPAPTRPP